MDRKELKGLMAAVAALSADEIDKVKRAVSLREGQVAISDAERERMALMSGCPHCGGKGFFKDGHTRNGRQRFRCKGCGRTFNALTGTPLARLHMPEKHLEHARLMSKGETIRATAKELGIDIKTAFHWRHRFLSAPLTQQPATLSGIVEADETFFLESFKGQRKAMPRPPKKRGMPAQKRGLSKEQIPVLVARERERGGTLTERIASRAAKDIAPPLSKRLCKDALLVSDSAKAYRRVAKELDVRLAQVPRSATHKTRGKVHVNNANNYCTQLMGWMFRFRGVATKYLPNYLAWHRILDREGDRLNPRRFLAASVG